MAPVFLYTVRNCFTNSAKIFMGRCMNIQLLPKYWGMTTVTYGYFDKENLARTHS